MKTFLLFIFSVLIAFTAFSQNQYESSLQKISKVNLLVPGYEFEKPIGQSVSIGIIAEMNFWGEFRFSGKFDKLDLVPSINMYSRWYYNMAKRSGRNKKTACNAANYFVSGIVLANPVCRIIEDEPSNQLFPANDLFESNFYAGIYMGWGLRRTIGSRCTFDFSLRVQPTWKNFNEFDVFWGPAIRIGYVLNKGN